MTSLAIFARRGAAADYGPLPKAAKRAPRSEVRRYDVEHFDIYVGETFERVVADEVAFLERHLLADVPAIIGSIDIVMGEVDR